MPFDQWPAHLGAALAGRWKVHCVDACESTQEIARTLGHGEVVVAWRQFAGRGRLGRAWIETDLDGVALTAVVEPAAAARLSVAAGVATAIALDELCRDSAASERATIGLKWPNDVHINGRKVAGVLIEVVDGKALIGIGVNVHQRSWPESLDGIAISLRQAGVLVDRTVVVVAVLRRLREALSMSSAELRDSFIARDLLVGTRRRIQVGEDVHEGIVIEVDPLTAIRLRLDDGRCIRLSAARANLLAPS